MPSDEDRVDPITLELIGHAVQAIPDLVEADLTRTAFSPLIYEYKDYAVGLVDGEGRAIALARQGIPIFLANIIGLAVRDGIAIYGAAGIAPGDVIITNHAGTLGQHLNNVVMYTPVFGANNRIVAFMSVIAHWIDIGGRYPGSCSGNDTTEIFQEGLQLRTVKLVEAGRRVEEIDRILRYNTRLPEALFGDLEAQLAGCLKGRQMFEDLLRRLGERKLFAGIHEIWRRTEAAARAAVAAIPDGIYQKRSFLDDDGVERGKPIPVDIKVRIEGSDFIVDFSDIGGQLRGPLNSGAGGGGDTCARIAFKYLVAPEGPANEGSFAPVKVILPPGKFLSASETAPLARYSTPLSTVIDTIIGAMAEVFPDRVAGGHHAAMGAYRFAAIDPQGRRTFVYLDTAHGGWGGSARGDGVGPYKTLGHADNKDIPVEVQEALYPVLVECNQWRPDSAGAGRMRGGLGTDKRFRILAPIVAHFSFERYGCPPWGVFGGRAAEPGWVEIEHRGRPVERVLKADGVQLAPGDHVQIRSGGGGGYGPPEERDPAAVLRDVRLGYVSRAAARDIYRVVIDDTLEIDAAETERSRAAVEPAGA